MITQVSRNLQGGTTGADEVQGSTAEPPRPAPLPRYTSRRPKQRTDARALSHHQRATTAHRTSPENMSKKPPNMPSQQDQLGQTWEQQQESPDRPPSRPTDYKTRPLAKLKNRRTRPPGLHQRFAGSPRTSRPKTYPFTWLKFSGNGKNQADNSGDVALSALWDEVAGVVEY